MTNRYASRCHRCGHTVPAYEGILTKSGGAWRVSHVDCAANAAAAVSTAPVTAPVTTAPITQVIPREVNTMRARNYNPNGLSIIDMQQVAPSIFATKPHHGTSDIYSFVPTTRVISALQSEGWMPVKAKEQRVRLSDRRGYQKHLITFRRADTPAFIRNVGDLIPELVLTNSHDGSSAFVLHAGLFRLVCSNGLVIADTTFASLRVKHVGYTDHDIIDASFRVIENVPRVIERVEEFRQIELSRPEQLAFAEAAVSLRWDEEAGEHPIIDASTALIPRRREDDRSDLFTTYNRIQENLVQGGLRGRGTTGKRIKVRSVDGIDNNIRLNKALWSLTEKMAELKA